MSHSHGPGQPCNHSHGQHQQQVVQAATPDPAMQALIDQDFKPVNLSLVSDNTQVVCGLHKLEKCSDCNLDFVNLNRLAKLLVNNPNLKCPPPSTIVSQNLSKAITTMKEEGNALFKLTRHAEALSRYTMAASVAVQRPPWEANQVMREELSIVLSNRSAAYFEAGDYISAIADADTVIQLRRNWSKGHFRKAKGLLGLGKWEEAKESIRLGLQFEPHSAELNSFLGEIDRVATIIKASKAKESDQKGDVRDDESKSESKTELVA